MKPEYDTPIRNIDDVLASNKKVFNMYGGEYLHKMFESSTDPRYAELGKNRFLKVDSYAHFDELMKRVINENDVINIMNYIRPWEKKLGSWYKSDESIT